MDPYADSEFFYADGLEKSFGVSNVDVINNFKNRWACIEQSIAIDGPGGERIVSLQHDIPEGESSDTLSCVEVSFDLNYIFATLALKKTYESGKMTINWKRTLSFRCRWIPLQTFPAATSTKPFQVVSGIVARVNVRRYILALELAYLS